MKHLEIEWHPNAQAAASARRELPKLIHEYFATGRGLDEKSPAAAMHDFRLQTKHLRYTLELFLPLYGPGLQTRIERLRPIQNALGERNDCEVFLAQYGPRVPAAARTFIKRRAAGMQLEFLRYWREEFDCLDEEKKWTEYLTRFARTKTAR